MTTPPGRRMGESARSNEADHPHLEIGAYLVGALSAADEAALERHLVQCALCQDRLVELAEALPALAQVPPDAAFGLMDDSRPVLSTAPSALPGTQSAGPRRAASYWRIAAAAGGVAAAVAAAVLVAVAIGAEDGTGSQAVGPAASSSIAIAPVSMVRVFPYTGDDQVTVRAWNSTGGAEVTVQCHNDRTPPPVADPDRATYELWAIRDDDMKYKVSSWKAVYGDDTFPGRLDFPVDRIKSFELRSEGDVLSVVQ